MGERVLAKAIDIALTQLRTRHDLHRQCFSRVLSPP